MLTLLFDIDGTLVRAGGAGLMAMQLAMAELHGIDQIPQVTVHGRTDYSIVSDIFDQLSVEVETARGAFCNRYCELLEETLPRCQGRVLPNVVELLEHLSVREDVSLGLLTGNMKRASDAKLRYFKLQQYFSYGGFGDHHTSRNDVASVAMQAAIDSLQDDFREENVWVLGDTVNDVTCARSIGAKVVAVETGGGTREDLESASPDLIYKTLPDPRTFLRDLCG
jgi:phosphoglycolate phosphatase